MGWWEDLFKSPAKKKTQQDKKRREALTKARGSLRRERRAIAKRQTKSEKLRGEAVVHERQGKSVLAKQAVKQFIQIEKETNARSMALANMEFTLEQVQVKDNYDDFVRGMRIVADIEELAQEHADPDEVRERLIDLAQRNQDLVEPWTEIATVDTAGAAAEAQLSPEEEEAYGQVVTDAAGEIESEAAGMDTELAKMNEDLERKMDETLGQE